MPGFDALISKAKGQLKRSGGLFRENLPEKAAATAGLRLNGPRIRRNGCVTGYSTGVGFFGHSAAETNLDMMALIGAAESFPGSGFLLPTRNSELMRWCLGHGLKITQPMNLMSRGIYQEPRGAFLSSVMF